MFLSGGRAGRCKEQCCGSTLLPHSPPLRCSPVLLISPKTPNPMPWWSPCQVDALATARDSDMHEATRRLLSVLLREVRGETLYLWLLHLRTRTSGFKRMIPSRLSKWPIGTCFHCGAGILLRTQKFRVSIVGACYFAVFAAHVVAISITVTLNGCHSDVLFCLPKSDDFYQTSGQNIAAVPRNVSANHHSLFFLSAIPLPGRLTDGRL